jgi:hypothetical protein
MAEVMSSRLRPMSGFFPAKYAPNVWPDLFGLYVDALGNSEWARGLSKVAPFLAQGEPSAVAEKGAAEELVRSALNAVTMVRLLYQQKPELCREVARKLPAWPVAADLAEPSWQRKAERLVQDLRLGCAIQGYIRSARTAWKNPIRRYAWAIYQTLFQTRWRYKKAEAGADAPEECPPWAAKTLALPPFTKPNLRAWASLGKEMLLEQRKDFLDDAALKEQKFKWTRRAENRSKSGYPTLRSIQNEAFDDFTKELRQLAPAECIYRGEW